MVATQEEIGGKLPIGVGTGTISTISTIESTKEAKKFGADAALVVTPYYVKPSQAGLLQHFTQIADAGGLPIVLYNVRRWDCHPFSGPFRAANLLVAAPLGSVRSLRTVRALRPSSAVLLAGAG